MAYDPWLDWVFGTTTPKTPTATATAAAGAAAPASAATAPYEAFLDLLQPAKAAVPEITPPTPYGATVGTEITATQPLPGSTTLKLPAGFPASPTIPLPGPTVSPAQPAPYEAFLDLLTPSPLAP